MKANDCVEDIALEAMSRAVFNAKSLARGANSTSFMGEQPEQNNKT